MSHLEPSYDIANIISTLWSDPDIKEAYSLAIKLKSFVYKHMECSVSDSCPLYKTIIIEISENFRLACLTIYFDMQALTGTCLLQMRCLPLQRCPENELALVATATFPK